jgi:hypothetical protein
LLLAEKGIAPGFPSSSKAEADQERLISLYGGNPLALKIVAETILDLFGGEIGEFLAGKTVLFGGVTDLLSEQFARLGALEQSLLCWLAVTREPTTLDELLAMLVISLPRVQVLEALDSLRRRSLIELGKHAGSFTLQSVVLEYMTAMLVAQGTHEIQERRLDRLIGHSLCQAAAHEYVRQTQEQLLLTPMRTLLQYVYLSGAKVEQELLGLLEDLREKAESTQGESLRKMIGTAKEEPIEFLFVLSRGTLKQAARLHFMSASRISPHVPR